MFPRELHLPTITIFTLGACCLHGHTLTYNGLSTGMTKKKAVISSPMWKPAHCTQPAWGLLLGPDADNWS